MHDAIEAGPSPHEIAQARRGLSAVEAEDRVLEALCATAMALGVAPLRSPLLALRASRALTALAGRGQVAPEDAVDLGEGGVEALMGNDMGLRHDNPIRMLPPGSPRDTASLDAELTSQVKAVFI